MIHKEALEYLIEVGEQRERVIPVHDDGTNETKLIVHKDGQSELKEFSKPPVERHHSFLSVDGFVDYLNSEHCKNGGIIFVDSSGVKADLNYLTHGEQFVTLPLKDSEEYSALRNLMRGVDQPALWELLVTKLNDCISSDLLLAIGSMKVHRKSESESKINVTGIRDSKGVQSTIIQYQQKDGTPQEAEIKVDWTFKGRIWECFDKEFEIKLRLVISVDDHIVFRFVPIRLDKVLLEARQALVKEIHNNLTPERFTVHEGTH